MASLDRPDVAIAGAGIAGLAAAISLARRGLRVICIDPDPPPRVRVGESLDWSAPALLTEIGISRDHLVATGAATAKREVRGATPTGDLMVGRPWDWLHRWPFKFERATVHVDRNQFDRVMWERARACGVELVSDHVIAVQLVGDHVKAFVTRSGDRVEAAWFIDASGRRRLLGRSAGIGREEWGCSRMALWAECNAMLEFEGTMLHLAGRDDDFAWAWEIPVAVGRLSIGVVVPLEHFQEQHRSGQSPDEIFDEHLSGFVGSGRDRLVRSHPVRTRSYRPYVSSRLAGENWAMIGEAAAFADPLTSNGVTAALRHASELAAVIADHADQPARTRARLRRFDKRSRRLAQIYNDGIESLMYESRLRRQFGIRWASRAYVPLGYLANSLYSRIRPVTPLRMAAFAPLGGLCTVWTRAWLAIASAGARSGALRSSAGRARGVVPFRRGCELCAPPSRRGEGTPTTRG